MLRESHIKFNWLADCTHSGETILAHFPHLCFLCLLTPEWFTYKFFFQANHRILTTASL